MTSAWLAAILLACAAAASATSNSNEPSEMIEANNAAGDEPDEDDGEGDLAPFMIVVEHADGWRCSGSLVSLRTALTSAWCARGRRVEPARELWALAASAAAPAPASPAALAARRDGARRVARLAVAAGADAEAAEAGDAGGGSWRGGAMDLAIVELEEPFGAAALARPILMSTTGEECAPAARLQCHVSRAVSPPGSHRVRLHIVGAELVSPDVCAAAADYWVGVRDRALCLLGPDLCESDWGGGVVCAGKLCGVLSRSVRGRRTPDAGAAEPDGGSCGDTHAAQSVARWRRFLHCAHTLRACGRDGDCADLCVERRLIDEPETDPPATELPTSEEGSTTSVDETTQASQSQSIAPPARQKSSFITNTVFYPTRTSVARKRMSPPPARTERPTASAPPATTLAAPFDDTPASPRPAFEFEPNRADFKVL